MPSDIWQIRRRIAVISEFCARFSALRASRDKKRHSPKLCRQEALAVYRAPTGGLAQRGDLFDYPELPSAGDRSSGIPHRRAGPTPRHEKHRDRSTPSRELEESPRSLQVIHSSAFS